MTNVALPEEPPETKVEIAVFHSAYGLRPGVLQWAERLRHAGLTVHTPDLYDGEVFNDRMDAVRKIQELGFDEMLARGRAAVSSLRCDLVYAGFSNGGACAETASRDTFRRSGRDPDARAVADSRPRLDRVAGDSARRGSFC